MQVTNLIEQFDRLQVIHGDKNLDAVYGAGQINSPKLCLVFMNPTGKNISSNKEWKGLKAPWIGAKNVWKMLYQLDLFDEDLFNQINEKKPEDWDYKFAEKVYREVIDNSLYITNLSKATQVDARPLKNEVFKEYLTLFIDEINSINPKVIITFGNQVSSILLDKSIKVSEYRKKHELVEINERLVKVFPVYYPFGQGMRNIEKAKEDIDWIIKNQI